VTEKMKNMTIYPSLNERCSLSSSERSYSRVAGLGGGENTSSSNFLLVTSLSL
jgi:hypothetical protein